MDSDSDMYDAASVSTSGTSVIDISDGQDWTDPQAGLRTYMAMHPPMIPNYVLEDGFMRHKEWSQDSWQFGARVDDSREGFDVRRLDINKYADIEIPRQGDWTADYRMGHPSQMPDWHPILEKFGFQILEKAGFLNYGNATAKLADPEGRYNKKINPNGDEEYRIDPVFWKDMWENISDEEYELLKPALLLASAILQDPTTLNFFYALSVPTANLHIYTDPILGDVKIADIPTTLSEAEQTATYKKILALRSNNWTRFQFGTTADITSVALYGYTQSRSDAQDQTIPASLPLTSQTEIYIAPMFLDALKRHDADVSNGTSVYRRWLKGRLDYANVPQNHRPSKIETNSAIARLNFTLADTLVHEFSHAFTSAYFPQKSQKAMDVLLEEPFIRGNRCSEVGFALANYIYGGVPQSMISPYFAPMDPLAYIEECTRAPFGIWFEHKWDQDYAQEQKDEHPSTLVAGAHADSHASRVIYPMPQKYIFNMDTEET